MAKLLVTGASGVLGKKVASQAEALGHKVVRTSRRDRPGFHRLDVRDRAACAALPSDIDVVVHCAASAFHDAAKIEAGGLQNLMHALPRARFIYPSIVGVDKIRFSYYRVKLQAEKVLESSGAEYVIVRLTQFHEFMDRFASMPIPFVPKNFRTQVLAADEAAAYLLTFVDSDVRGRAPELGGPEVHDMHTLVKARARSMGRRLPVLRVPMGKFSKDLAAGHNLCPDRALGKTTWEEYLEQVAMRTR